MKKYNANNKVLSGLHFNGDGVLDDRTVCSSVNDLYISPTTSSDCYLYGKAYAGMAVTVLVDSSTIQYYLLKDAGPYANGNPGNIDSDNFSQYWDKVNLIKSVDTTKIILGDYRIGLNLDNEGELSLFYKEKAKILGNISYGSFLSYINDKYTDDTLSKDSTLGIITPQTGYNIPSSVSLSPSFNTSVNQDTGEIILKENILLPALTIVNASCNIQQYAVTLVISENQSHVSIDKSKNQKVDYNAQAIWYLSLDDGYYIVDSIQNGYKKGNVIYSDAITGDTTVTVDCSLSKYNITVVPQNVTVSGDITKTVYYGSTTSWYIEPADGYDLPQSVANATISTNSEGKHILTTDLVDGTFTTILVNGVARDGVAITFNVTNGSATSAISGKYVGDKLTAGTKLGTISTTAAYNLPTSVSAKDADNNAISVNIDASGNVTLVNEITLTQTTTITAVCTIKVFSASLTANHGSTTDTNPVDVSYNNTASWTLTPDTGYHYLSVTNGTKSDNTDGTIKITSNKVTSDVSVLVDCSINRYDIGLTASGLSLVSGDATLTVDYGKTGSWKVALATGYKEPITVTNGSMNIDTSIITSKTVDGTFSTVTATATARTSVKVSGTITDGSFTSAISGKYVDDVLTAGTKLGTIAVSNSAKFNLPTTVKVTDADGTEIEAEVSNSTGIVTIKNEYKFTSSLTVTAVCVIKTFNVTLDVSNGFISGTTLNSSTKTVEYGGSLTWTIEANSGYELADSTTTDCTLDEETGVVTVSNVTKTQTVKVSCHAVEKSIGYYGFSTNDPTADPTIITTSLVNLLINAKPLYLYNDDDTLHYDCPEDISYLIIALPYGSVINSENTVCISSLGTKTAGFGEAWYKPSEVGDEFASYDTITISDTKYSVYITDIGVTKNTKSITIDWD